MTSSYRIKCCARQPAGVLAIPLLFHSTCQPFLCYRSSWLSLRCLAWRNKFCSTDFLPPSVWQVTIPFSHQICSGWWIRQLELNDCWTLGVEHCAPGSRNKFRGAAASLHFPWEEYKWEAEDAKNLCVNCSAYTRRVFFILLQSVELDFVCIFASCYTLPQSLTDGVRGWDGVKGKVKIHFSWTLLLFILRTAKWHW